MRRAAIVVSLALALNGCGEAEEEEAEIAPAEGEPATQVAGTTSVALPSPTRGGTVVMAGTRPFEIVADRAGQVSAYYVSEPPAQPQDARVTVRIPDQSGQVRPVLLTWDPAEVKYTGFLRGSPPAPGPIELVWVLGGETLRASAQTYVIMEAAVQVAAGNAPRPRPVVVGEPPPPPQIVVQQPPPPPQVIVQPPPPPQPRVIVQPPPPPPRPQVIVRPAEPPPPPRVVVRAPEPPRPQVVVRPAEPPQPRVVVRPAEPPPPPRVVVRQEVQAQPPPPPRVIVRPPPGDRNRGHGNDRDGEDEDNPGRGRRGR